MDNSLVNSVTEVLNTFLLRFSILREWRIEHAAHDSADQNEAFYLEIIGQYDGILPSELARFLNKSQGSISPLLRSMIKKGLICEDKTKGKRKKPVRLTVAGMLRLNVLRNQFSRNIASFMTGSLTAEELVIVSNALEILSQKIDDRFEEINAVPVPLLFF